MTTHLKMDEPDNRNRLDNLAQGVIGQPLDRPDGPLKVLGRATYANEYAVDDLAHGVLVRATAAKGRVSRVDAEAVEARNGMLAVITDERLLRNPAQGTANEAPVQGPSDVAYFGQPIALVVAETFEQARHGAQSLVIEIENEAAAVDPEADRTEVESPDGTSQGDLDQAMKDAVHSVDVIYRTPGHNSAAMEPHASIAEWDGDKLTLRGSYQMLKFNRNELADSLGIDPENIRILSPYVGGGFGSKLGIAPEAVAAAIAARQLQRPVSVALTRPQVFEAVMRRSESRQRIRLAADAHGRLTGIGQESLVSNLPGESFSEPVGQATHFLYRGENREISEKIARVNRTCAGSVRAPGEAIGIVVLENAMDELAHEVGIDPLELRKRNIPEDHPENDKPFSSRRFADCLDRGAEKFGWADRKTGGTRDGEWLIGTGMASAVRVNMLMESRARVTLGADGKATVETDMTDLGTGTYAILTQIAAEMLGLPVERVTVTLGDTRLPAASGSGGSWGAASSGSSVFLACEDIRGQICRQLGCKDDDLTLKDGSAIYANTTTPLEDILDGGALTAEGHIEPGEAGEKTRQATYGAYFAEVAVSAVTGETRVRRMHGTFSAGRILNAKTARSQCLGGMVWGIGMALTEELAFDPRDGHIVNHDLGEYHVAVNADVPQITVDLLEERDPWANPLQAKGIGELGICGAAASITNAIHDATGVRVRDYPATLDKVIAGM
ncbi:xanthine dehydrogenase family protein molybdopterin-binding subunit [Paracoccaceae bacterium GXU_MW_L88]